jgi:hypothetical protein
MEEAETHGSEVEHLTWEECVQLLVELFKAKTSWIVLDAFDELENGRRAILFEVFDNVIADTSKGSTISSLQRRHDGDIAEKLKEYDQVLIEATDNQQDIKRFIEMEVNKAIQNHRMLNCRVPEKLKTEIIKVLEQGAQGMYVALETTRKHMMLMRR